MTSGVPSSSTRSHRGRRAGLTALLSGALIAGGIVIATSAGPASAADPVSTPPEPYITLQTGSVNELKLYKPGTTTATKTQSLGRSGQCTLTTVSSLVSFTGKNGTVGLRQGSIGVFTKSGEACGQVNGTEELTLDLGSKRASTAVLDLELISNAVVNVTIVTDTATEPIRRQVQSGRSIDPSSDAIKCQEATSSGPNSSSSDNCRVVFNVPKIKSITLAAATGSFALEGGADGKAALTAGTEPSGGYPMNLSYFVLEELFECKTGSVTVTRDVDKPSTPTVTIRDVDVSDATECSDFSYSLSTDVVDGAPTATFTKPWSPQSEKLEFMMDLTWVIPTPAPDTAATPENAATTGNFADLPVVSFGFHSKAAVPVKGPAYKLPWCANPVFKDGLVVDLATTPTLDMEKAYFPMYHNNPDYPGIQYACMATSTVAPVVSATFTGNGSAPTSWFQSIYVHGDAYARR